MFIYFLNDKGLKKTSVVGVGLDISAFSDDVTINIQTEIILQTMANNRVLLYVGRISKRKNVELIIKVFNILKLDPNNDDLQLYLIGSDEAGYLQTCMKLIEKQSLGSVFNISSMSNSQLRYLYKRAELFLLPSRQEIFGMVLLEAMYFGLPTIASPSAGAKTLIENGKNGYIVDSFDENEWVKLIHLVLSNQKLSKKIGESATNRIKENFLWNHIVGKMISQFDVD